MKKSLRTSFNESVFVRQQDGFSCAAASCATVARLYRLDKKRDYEFFRKELKTDLRGVCLTEIFSASGKYLPVSESGLNVYKGGIAIGLIRHKPSGDDHVVVFLAKKGDTLVYYDPLDDRIYKDQTRNMRRSSIPNNPYRTWTANFPAIEGLDFSFWEGLAVQNPFPLEKQAFMILKKKTLKT